MINIQLFPFNAFQVNTVVLSDESKECVIIDAACYEDAERKALVEFIKTNDLKPVKLVNTHCHIDHILGNNFVGEYYKLGLEIHAAGQPFLDSAPQQGSAYGFSVESQIKPSNMLEEGDIIKFGQSELEVLYCPGHADGSICLVNHENKFVVVGDVLFNGSIGRTDLPTGNFDVLKSSIQDKLFKLADDYVVIPGHGPQTTIGEEKRNNPFVGIGR